MWPHRCHLQGNLQLPRAGSTRNPEVGGLANSPRFRPVNRLESVSVCITTPHAYFADQQLLTSDARRCRALRPRGAHSCRVFDTQAARGACAHGLRLELHARSLGGEHRRAPDIARRVVVACRCPMLDRIGPIAARLEAHAMESRGTQRSNRVGMPRRDVADVAREPKARIERVKSDASDDRA